MPPMPPSAEAKVTLLPPVSKVALVPPSTRREEMSVVVPAAHCRPPPFKVTRPVPKLFSAEKFMRPPLTVVPPVKVLAPRKARMPLPCFISPPSPVICEASMVLAELLVVSVLAVGFVPSAITPPVPERAPTVRGPSSCDRSRVPPFTVSAPAALRPEPLSSCRTPAFTVVPPE